MNGTSESQTVPTIDAAIVTPKVINGNPMPPAMSAAHFCFAVSGGRAPTGCG